MDRRLLSNLWNGSKVINKMKLDGFQKHRLFFSLSSDLAFIRHTSTNHALEWKIGFICCFTLKENMNKNEIGENQGNVQSTNHLHRLSELGWSWRNWWGRETADTTDSLTSDSAVHWDSGSLFFTTCIGLPACSHTSSVHMLPEKSALKPPASLPLQGTLTSH